MQNNRFSRYGGSIATVAIGAMVAVLVLLAADVLPPTRSANAHVDPPGHTDLYSYDNSNCTGEVDPISVVFYNNASYTQVHNHAATHGGWGSHDPSQFGYQYIFEHNCTAQEHQDASNSFYTSRFHMRLKDNWDIGYGTYTVATPHQEDIVAACNFRHAVKGTDEPPGGFVSAKWDIGWNWHNWNNGGGAHYFGGSAWWGNTAEFLQCDGQEAGNDGWVDFIRIG